MSKLIKPFQAAHYNPELVKDFSKVVCPPYDIIDKKKAESLKKLSPYNYCRVSLAEKGDYSKPAFNLKNWLRKKILVEDNLESYYLYQQMFKFQKKKFSCYGIFCLLSMEKGNIFPHEHVLAKPKEDRRKMISKVKANLSPIFMIAKGGESFLSFIVKKYENKKPFIAFQEDSCNSGRIWQISSPQDINKITAALGGLPMLIADGHHRFETSKDYFSKNKGKFKDLNYVLTYLTALQPGLLILPTHRIATLSEKQKASLENLKNNFNLEPVSQTAMAEKFKKSRKFCFGVYSVSKFYFATLKKNDILSSVTPSIYRKLDSYLFHKFVLSELSYRKIDYSHTIEEATEKTKRGQMAFFLKPASLNSVFKAAEAGYKLPQKSTYFYPKIFSGTVLRRFKK